MELNFNKKGKVHKTLIGGIASIFILVIYYYYVGWNFKKMLLHESDNTGLDIHQLHRKDAKNLSINNTDVITFYIISKQLENSGPLYTKDRTPRDVSKYIDIAWM